MSIRKVLGLRSIIHSILFILAFLGTFSLPHPAQGQGLEVGGGYTHVTGDFGTDGFNAGAAWWFNKKVTVAADYDSAWDTSSLTNFAFSSVGAIATKSHLQNFLVGPRVLFSTNWTDKHKLNPFGEAQFGLSHLSQSVTQVGMPTLSASDTGFTWMLGGGADYLFSPHWMGRANLDFERTHLANEGQSRLRLVLGVRYTFGSRERKLAAAGAAASQQSVSVTAKSPARVHITSSPTGGQIYVDGKFYGNTPSEIVLYTGDYSVKIVANDKEWSRTVHITAGDIRIEADLSKP